HPDAPEWFRDAKLGIYFHWGVYSVPAFASEWYPRMMFLKGDRVNLHHIATYGDPAEYGYDKFAEQWKTPKFDAAEWAALFQRAGARFAGPVAEHHDGFSLWNSAVTPWNAVNKGPHRDIVGELGAAMRAQGLKFITTFHHARNHYGHFDGMVKDYPQAMADPEVAILYGQMPTPKFHEFWLAKLKEVIDQYQPDIMWFDSWLDQIPEDYRQRFCAYYLNSAAQWGREVVIVRKQNDLPIEFTVNDHEKSRESKSSPRVWMTDDTISTGSWCYTQDLKIKPASKVIHALIDTVAKNGVVLLNISPMADGTIPDDQRGVLEELGDWLRVNGEGIYATRPWKVFGEGPTVEPEGGFSASGKFLRLEYSAEDIRYTQSKDGRTLYAFTLGWPGGEIVFSAVKVRSAGPMARVRMLGGQEDLKYSLNDQGRLVVHLPDLPEANRPARHAFGFELTGFDIEAARPIRHVPPVVLSADQAVLDGAAITVEQKNGRPNIGFWDNPSESAHWLVKIPEPGTYAVEGEFAATSGNSRLILRCGDQAIAFTAPNTGDFGKTLKAGVGELTFDQAGVQHLVLAANPGGW
ncbi:MAG: alpha-L-fucosidase, partial [Verrucomicrobiae bacterium]|nr:alpha-L-fucosidase [Verrucomicrobiae bacterium]